MGRLLVTAGPTREPIDAVRFISNDSTGKFGYAIAEAAVARGWAVCLVSGPVPLPEPPGVERILVTTAAEMYQAADQAFARCDAAIFSAAVCDHTPAVQHPGKLHKAALGQPLKLVETVDIAAALGAKKGGRITIGFALETDDPEGSALRKLKDKHLDAIVLNSPSSFGSDQANVVILSSDREPVPYERMTKREIADRIVDRLGAAP